MTAINTIERIEALLSEERDAIRAIDADRIEALAYEKMELVERLTVDALGADEELDARFRTMTSELRNNAVILAHARNCLRDLVRLSVPPPATYGQAGRLNTGAGNNRVSVKG